MLCPVNNVDRMQKDTGKLHGVIRLAKLGLVSWCSWQTHIAFVP